MICHIVASYESGVLEDPACEAPDDMYTMTCSPQQAPDRPDKLQITFKKG